VGVKCGGGDIWEKGLYIYFSINYSVNLFEGGCIFCGESNLKSVVGRGDSEIFVKILKEKDCYYLRQSKPYSHVSLLSNWLLRFIALNAIWWQNV
jgi:hypothetical protein